MKKKHKDNNTFLRRKAKKIVALEKEFNEAISDEQREMIVHEMENLTADLSFKEIVELNDLALKLLDDNKKD